MQELLAACAESFDFVLVDSPPVLSVTEGVLLSVMVDTTMVVVRAGQTTKAALRRALNMLSQVNARVVGVALNAVDLKREQGYYGQYYYYNRGYYGDEKQASAVASD
jgi:Mrp family chromosome partitioning ATPase